MDNPLVAFTVILIQGGLGLLYIWAQALYWCLQYPTERDKAYRRITLRDSAIGTVALLTVMTIGLWLYFRLLS